ncbi:hypothetical protein [Epilithonimonas sp.]|uniref:hypothetical protein n=1 Tax=Epilithonimonas sp. TaxID=2894511 RepID=UPI00289A0A69|nr:hypothetical protein [Epilithonimonas sp.]
MNGIIVLSNKFLHDLCHIFRLMHVIFFPPSWKVPGGTSSKPGVFFGELGEKRKSEDF